MKLLKKTLCILIALFLTLQYAPTVFAYSDLDVDSTVNSTENVLTAEFTDIPTKTQIEAMRQNGNDVTKKISKDLQNAESSTREMPGYRTVYGNMVFNTCKINPRYNFIGQARAFNSSSQPGILAYTQETTKSTDWSVSTSVSGDTDVSVPFLAKIKASLGVTVGKNNTTSRTTTASYTMTVSPGKTGFIDAYHQSGYASGYIPVKGYDNFTNKLVFDKNIEVYGHAIVASSIYYEVYEK